MTKLEKAQSQIELSTLQVVTLFPLRPPESFDTIKADLQETITVLL
jgi:hypothetical protein